jgi:hypothetical protein
MALVAVYRSCHGPIRRKKPEMSQRLENAFVFSEWYGQIAAQSPMVGHMAEMF